MTPARVRPLFLSRARGRIAGALILALAFVLPPSAVARDWIVSTEGHDDSGDGTVARPFRTLGRALNPSSGAQDGDTVMLRGIPGANVYEECAARLRFRLTLRSYPGEAAHIRCPLKVEDSVLVLDREASGSTISDLELSGSAYYAVKFNTDWSPGEEGANRGTSNVVLENLRIHDTGRDGIKITPKCDHITIRRSEIWNTGAGYPPGTPQAKKNADGIDNVNGSNMIVEDNYIHDIATTGLYFKGGAKDVLVQRNRIERTGSGGIRVGFDTDEDAFDTKVNPGFYESIGAVVRNNYVSDTPYAGIALYGAKDATIVNNTIVDAAKTGQAALYFGITIDERSAEAGRPSSVNPKIERNLVLQRGGACVDIAWRIHENGKQFIKILRWKIPLISALQGSPGTDRNLYYDTSGRCRFIDRRKVLSTMSFEEWQGREPADRDSSEMPFAIDESTGRLRDAEGSSSGIGVLELPNRTRAMP